MIDLRNTLFLYFTPFILYSAIAFLIIWFAPLLFYISLILYAFRVICIVLNKQLWASLLYWYDLISDAFITVLLSLTIRAIISTFATISASQYNIRRYFHFTFIQISITSDIISPRSEAFTRTIYVGYYLHIKLYKRPSKDISFYYH